MDLTSALGSTLVHQSEPAIRSTIRSQVKGGAAPADPTLIPPVFQLAAMPQMLDVSLYANALSPSNPGGSEKPLAAFRALVDPVPSFSRLYSPSASSTEQMWSAVLSGSVQPGHGFTATRLSDANKTFSSTGLAGLTIADGSWHAVYPTQPTWTDLQHQNWTSVIIDPAAPSGTSSGYSYIGSPADHLQWRTDASQLQLPLAPSTRIKAIAFEAFEVLLVRPWLDTALFSAAGLYFSGQAAGFLSTGAVDGNDGLLPLLPIGFFVARNIKIEGQLDSLDQQRLMQSQAAGRRLSLGNFLIVPGGGRPVPNIHIAPNLVSSPTVQIIAWVSKLVPRCPQITGP